MKIQIRKILLNLLLKIQKDFERADKIDQQIRIEREKIFLNSINIQK
jgi:hypothetical protein